MNATWVVAILFLFVIAGAVLVAAIIEIGVNRLGAIIVIGNRSLYRSEDEAVVFFGKLFETITHAPGRVLLIAGPHIRVLRPIDFEGLLSIEELAALTSRLSSGKIICIVRNNELAQKATNILQHQDELAAYYREHPELTSTFERSDKSTFVAGI